MDLMLSLSFDLEDSIIVQLVPRTRWGSRQYVQ